jgi:hypothetical protein
MFQTVEEVSFAANGITGDGIKAFDGVLQSNIILKTLDLSGNPIGDEGIKVSPSSLLMSVYFDIYLKNLIINSLARLKLIQKNKNSLA